MTIGKTLKKYKAFYIMMIPGILYLLVFRYIPMLGLTMSFQDYKIFKGIYGSKWVGLANYIKLFSTRKFVQVFSNTMIINFYKIIFGFPAPVILALLINETNKRRFKQVVQTVIYLPHFISWIVVAGLLDQILSPGDGVVNQIIKNLGFQSIYFLGESKYFRGILVISDIWKEAGWCAIIYIAALIAIPLEMYEAATIDGSSRFQKLIYITIPQLIPTITVMLILKCGQIMNKGFDQVFALYNSAVYDVGDIIDTYVYRMGIIDMKYGLSAAAGVFKSVVGCILVVVANCITKKMGEESLF